MSDARIQIDGKAYVLLPEPEYHRLKILSEPLPELPAKDERGDRPAVATAKVHIARGIIRRRLGLLLAREELARLAKVRVETLRRLESGHFEHQHGVIKRVDRALQTAERRAKRNPPSAKSSARVRRSAA